VVAEKANFTNVENLQKINENSYSDDFFRSGDQQKKLGEEG